MNLRSKRRSHQEPHGSALNDILFILLLFFLIISTLANPNVIKVMNPKGETETKSKQTVVVTIDSMRQFYVSTHMVPADSLKDAISAAVARSDDKEPTVVINGDQNAQWGEIVTVMRAAKELHLKVVASVEKGQ